MFKRALQHHQREEIEKARLLYQEILVRMPAHFDARLLLGMIADREKAYEIAIEHWVIAVASDPVNADIHALMGNAYCALHRYNEALASYERALEIDAGNVAVLIGSALPAHKLGRNEEALARLDLALQRSADSVDALICRGNVLAALGRPLEAVPSFDRALQIDAQNAAALNNRGAALHAIGHVQDALDSFDRALQIEPRFRDAHCNKGLLLCDLQRCDEAMGSYQRALDIDPQYPKVQYNQSLCRLLTGDFEHGWRQYEWRWKLEPSRGKVCEFPQPLWLGAASLQGKTLLLHAEQGLGDTIQFCRYAELARDLGAHVILRVDRPLARLLKSLAGVVVVAPGEPLPPFDYHCPLMSLPFAFRTTLDTIPSPHRYLSSEPGKFNEWAARLGKWTKPRIGLVWSGGFRPEQPELWSVNERRNVKLAKLAALRNERYEFYSLQKGQSAESELTELKAISWDGPEIIDFSAQLLDFSDTAALIDHLDLVISVDTSTAHLAGALGTPTWILNRFDTCWRWLLERDDSAWYPSVRLFRQARYGDWDGVIQRLQEVLVRQFDGLG
jgi:tetratricopeptide (TPR) repeat protein